jgi:CRP/FNR family transcriptional regulator
MNVRAAAPYLVRCTDCPIRHRAVCARCEPDELARLEGMKSYQELRAGEPILSAGEPMEHVATVVRGAAVLSRSMEDGRRQVLGLLLPSDFIGRPGRERARFDVEAVTDTVLCRFRRAPFERLVSEMPHVGERLLEMALDELDAAREWMALLGRKSARERVASLIAYLARRSATLKPDGRGVSPKGELRVATPLTRETMADHLGMTLETASRQINALRREGVIRLEGARMIVVPDLARLEAETGDDTPG